MLKIAKDQDLPVSFRESRKRIAIRQALKKSGIDAQIHVADDGEKTVRFFEQADADASAASPDLILLDINMPRYK